MNWLMDAVHYCCLPRKKISSSLLKCKVLYLPCLKIDGDKKDVGFTNDTKLGAMIKRVCERLKIQNSLHRLMMSLDKKESATQL